MTKLSLALILASVFSGGDSLLRTPVTQPEQINTQQAAQEVVMIRDSGIYAANVHLWPTLNGQDLAGLHNEQYIRFHTNKGLQSLGVRCFGGMISAHWWHDSLNITAREDNTRYFRLETRVNGCAHIVEVTETEAKPLLHNAHKRQLGSISSCRNVSTAWFSEDVQPYCY